MSDWKASKHEYVVIMTENGNAYSCEIKGVIKL